MLSYQCIIVENRNPVACKEAFRTQDRQSISEFRRSPIFEQGRKYNMTVIDTSWPVILFRLYSAASRKRLFLFVHSFAVILSLAIPSYRCHRNENYSCHWRENLFQQGVVVIIVTVINW